MSGRQERMNGMADMFADAIGRARDAASDAVSTVTGRLDGTLDIWNLGNYEVRHMASVMRFLTLQRYDDIDIDTFRELSRNTDVMEGFSRMCDSGCLLDGATCSNEARRESAIIDSMARDRFTSAWEWVGTNLMTGRYVVPSGYGIVRDDGIAYVEPTRDMISGIPDRITHGVTALDIARLPSREVGSLASKLERYVSMNVGSPCDYFESGKTLIERNDGWTDARGIWTMFAPSSVIDFYGLNPTNREIGVDYSSWTEDIIHAADVLKSWSEWTSGNEDSIPCASRAVGIPDEEIDKLGTQLEDEFQRCWAWIGQHICELWI